MSRHPRGEATYGDPAMMLNRCSSRSSEPIKDLVTVAILFTEACSLAEGAGLGEPFEVSAGLTEALPETLDSPMRKVRLLRALRSIPRVTA